MKNYYEIFGVSQNADLPTIKKAAQEKINEIKAAFKARDYEALGITQNADIKLAAQTKINEVKGTYLALKSRKKRERAEFYSRIKLKEKKTRIKLARLEILGWILFFSLVLFFSKFDIPSDSFLSVLMEVVLRILWFLLKIIGSILR